MYHLKWYMNSWNNKRHSTELMSQQENHFKDSSNKRLDGLTREVQFLKTSVQFTQNEVDGLKQAQARTSEHLHCIKADLTSLQETALNISTKTDYIENQSRRNNIIIHGVDESPNEKWTETEEKFRSLLSEKMKIDHQHIEIERAHRSGKPVSMGIQILLC